MQAKNSDQQDSAMGIGSHTKDTEGWHVECLASSARDGLTAQESDRARPPPALGPVMTQCWLEIGPTEG